MPSVVRRQIYRCTVTGTPRAHVDERRAIRDGYDQTGVDAIADGPGAGPGA
jgi:hypothetical protein